MAYDIRSVRNITDLIGYFSENLNWAIDIDDFDDIEDISYDFEAEDIGLKEENFAKISSLRQLQPLVDGQQWGIFCIEFDSNKFEVSALRKILSKFVPKRRSMIDHAVWEQQDLLFICNWGEDNNRTIGIAHFEDQEKGLPQIKMISCAPALEDFTQIKVFEDRLAQLAWPKNTSNIAAWREAWSNAFASGYRQTIQDSSTLTIQLAAEAQNIRNRILSILDVETKNGYVHLLYDKFKDTLIHDMTEQQFADMYAQTVVYGLFSARCMDSTQDDFSAAEAIDCIPSTNPFLKSLMRECLGSQGSNKLSFDELEIGNVVDLLLHTKTDEIIKDFNRQTGGGREDPVIHFYEEFLTAYDKSQKVQRGVYYTPQPVVNFIVRAVDSILKTEFGYEDGLASTDTKKIKVMRDSRRRVNGYKTQVEEQIEVPAVQILDPATGTGTFLRQTILQIYENFQQKHKGEPKDRVAALWNKYVDGSLLPRLNGFELMMAPYAVAHMKLAMVLKDTGYDFSGEHRLNVFLTNSLEKAGNSDNQLTLFEDPLALESIVANKAKKNTGINVIIGNPPYAGASSNKGEWIMQLMETYKKEPGGVEKLQEKNPKWINDDYVKFIRYAQSIVQATDSAVLAYICPHGFLNNPTFRGMRWSLIQAFDEIYSIDLHGNSNRKETCPDGSKDENVFDIQQGVGIVLMVRRGGNEKNRKCKVYQYDCFGIREKKYDFLQTANLFNIDFEEVPLREPLFLFKKQNLSIKEEYEKGIPVVELFPLNGVGITTAHDDFVIDINPEVLVERFTRFRDSTCNPDSLYEEFNVRRKEGWDITEGWKNLQGNEDISGMIYPISYRPFDTRYIFYEDKLVWRTVRKIMSHMIPENLGFVSARSNKGTDSSQFFVTEHMMETKFGERTTQSAVFPLFVYSEAFGKLEKNINLNVDILNKIEKLISKKFTSEKEESDPEVFDAYDVFDYLYANVYSSVYREKYHDFLNIDFPVIPYPTSKEQFERLVSIGTELRYLHLLKGVLPKVSGSFVGEGANGVDKGKYDSGCVFINKNQYFTNVSEAAWNFLIGGYQPLQKWLKDRKGMKLSQKDIDHYLQVVSVIERTIELMREIDSTIQSQ